MNDDKYPRVRLTNLFGQIARTFGGQAEPARYEASERGPVKVVPADAIVIERESLHPVAEEPGFLVVHPEFGEALSVNLAGQRYGPQQTNLWDGAIARISLAVHLEEHPSVDEAQVEALSRLLVDANAVSVAVSEDTAARRLIATGRVHVDTEDGAL